MGRFRTTDRLETRWGGGRISAITKRRSERGRSWMGRGEGEREVRKREGQEEGKGRRKGGKGARRRGTRHRIYSRNGDTTATPSRDTREGQEDADDDLHNSIFKTGAEGVARRDGAAQEEDEEAVKKNVTERKRKWNERLKLGKKVLKGKVSRESYEILLLKRIVIKEVRRRRRRISDAK